MGARDRGDAHVSPPFVEYDPAVSAEGRVITLDEGWRFVGARQPPLVTVVEGCWIPRPGQL